MSDGQGTTISVGNISAADLMQDERARNDALQAFLQGGTTYGSPNREEQLGMGSQNPDELRPEPPTFAEQVSQAEQAIQTFNSQGVDTSSLESELAEWKKKFGDRENEFGAIRRQNAELQEALNLLLTQRQGQPAIGMPAAYPNSGPYPMPTQNQPPYDPLADISDDDLVQGSKLKKLIQETIGPAIASTWQQAQQAQAELGRLRQTTAVQAKAAAGISPLDELRLQAKYPALASMPEDDSKIGLMKTLLTSERAQAQPAPQAAPVQAPVQQTQPTGNVVRRVVHTGINQGQGGDVQVDRNSAMKQEMEAAKAQPFHLRAQAMEAVLRKYQVPTLQTFGSGRYRF